MEDLDLQVLRAAHGWSAAGLATLLVTVTRTWGSSPRPPGSLMALNGHGDVAGSVSGGCIEDDLIERARRGDLPLPADGPSILRYGLGADEAHRFGLPCGGTVELVLEPVAAHSRLPELLQACEARRITERVLDLRTGAVALRPGRHDDLPHRQEDTLTTQFGPGWRLVVIGASDLSAFLCEMARGLNFEVLVCEPREDYRQGRSIPGAQWHHDMPDDLIQALQPDARTAIVALTHDPRLDDLALIDALQSPAFYVGAIGSRRHARARCQRLQEHFALDAQALARLHSPAGLYIGSKTPAEIALSIMAAIVAAKNGIACTTPVAVATGKAMAMPETAN